MEFKGKAQKLQPGEIGQLAASLKVETAVLLAFLEVEAGSKGFGPDGRPIILNEPHQFYKLLSGAQRAEAVRQGLAYRNWGDKPYPRTQDDRYEWLAAARKINPEIALAACSWGMGQTMGFNAELCGFSSPSAMVESYKESEYNQIVGMGNFLKNRGIIPFLRNRDFSQPDSWRQVASRYNGAGYERNNYHTKMAAAYRKHAKKEGTPIVKATTLLKRGVRGEAVRELQLDLIDAGYAVEGGADGIFGSNTDIALKQFQLDANLEADGKYGPATRKALEAHIGG